jgi:predicted AlkP superfamily pyrophosphatase or phosphodiesterase
MSPRGYDGALEVTRRLGLAAVLLLVACGRGTSVPGPAPDGATLVLVSIDGFRPDYLQRAASVRLRRLAAQGAQARWLEPVAPTLTFPNHYSIVTGLFPAHHGVVGNAMFDPAIGYRFSIHDTAAVRDPRWWGGEPIWVTAVKQGRRSATFFWPGSEAPIGGVRPTYVRAYDAAVPNRARVRQVLDWLRLPAPRAPSLVTLYFSDVDAAGHRYGPEAAQVDSAIARVDSAVGALVDGLEAMRAGGRVNLVIVSDHGMTEVSRDRLIYLDDYLPLPSIRVDEWAPILGITPLDGAAEPIYERLRGRHPHLAVYRRAEAPPRFHFDANPRLAPVIAVADEGWLVTTHAIMDTLSPGGFPKGMHGYDPAVPAMRAFLVARGPAFRQGVVVPPFTNVHLYALMAHILGLRPAPNDGVIDSAAPLLGHGAAAR